MRLDTSSIISSPASEENSFLTKKFVIVNSWAAVKAAQSRFIFTNLLHDINTRLTVHKQFYSLTQRLRKSLHTVALLTYFYQNFLTIRFKGAAAQQYLLAATVRKYALLKFCLNRLKFKIP